VHGRLRPAAPERPPVPEAAASAAAEPLTIGTAALAAAARRDAEVVTHPADLLAVEIAAAALLVAGGTVERVVVCNAPASIDFDEVRLLADRYGVRIEPVVRIGGGIDLAVLPPASHDATPPD
jgi:hypothetical protein